MRKLWSMTKGARYVDGVLVEEYDHGTKSSMGPAMVSFDDYAALEAQSIAKDERIAKLDAALLEIKGAVMLRNWEAVILFCRDLP